MKDWNQAAVRLGMLMVALCLASGCASKTKPVSQSEPVLLVVMDPLAKELACACVKGYGQRDYRKLAARLESSLGQRVSIEFSDDLAGTLALATPGHEMVVIGEQSVVVHGAKQAGLKCHPLCELTDPEGGTAISGSFVTRSGDSAGDLKDIGGRKLLFGLADTRENHEIAQAALREAGVEASTQPEQRGSYSEAALDVLDSRESPPPVAVIPGYALRLLEGCGSITPGDLKVLGKTSPLPFIAVFVSDDIVTEKQQAILKTLLEVRADATLLNAMESRDGFKTWSAPKAAVPRTDNNGDWPDWRGPHRDGHVPRLPARLPEKAKVLWKKAAMTGGLAGLSVSGARLILAERDFGDVNDVYRCLNADSGDLLWRAEFSAPGHLDYGQSPRATPVIHEGRAYLLGAFGELRCVNVTDGTVLWKRHLPGEFEAELPTWGLCSTPLVVDDLLIVNPGAPNASLAALDSATGRTRWTTPGLPAAYASFICGEFGGRRQIVGYDQISLGGWDVKTGERLWQLVPPNEGDFNVPTPIAAEGGLLISTENNGTRFHRFDAAGRIIAKPESAFRELAPDTATPVVAAGRLFGAHVGLHCLDLRNGLQPVWRHDDDALGDYVTLIADDDRVLVVTLGGELILLDARANDCAIISRLRAFDDDVEVYSHPALVDTRLYVRGGSSVVCLDLATNRE